jgi:polyphosphate glucokinase
VTGPPPTAVVDVGGTAIKSVLLDETGAPAGDPVRRPTPYPCPPERLLEVVGTAVDGLGGAGRVTVGFPGLLRSDRVVQVNSLMRRVRGGPEDERLATAWRGFPLQEMLSSAIRLPVRVANDADVAALASVAGAGLECVLTLGTGVGSSLIQDGVLLPHLELGGAPFRDGRDLESCLGSSGLETAGRARWTEDVLAAVGALRRVLYFDLLHLGGGNARLLNSVELPEDVRLVDNVNGLLGGHLLWSR